MPTTTALLPSRTEIIAGMLDEYGRFTDLISGLSDDDWTTPTRCGGAPVRDVAGHVVGILEDVNAGKPASRVFEEEAAAMRDESPAQAAARLTAAIEGLTKRDVAPARIELTGRDHPTLELGAVDTATPTHQVDPHDFLLAATGRLDATTVGLDPSVNIYAE